MKTDRKILEELSCSCGLSNPEPKYHSTDCIYREGWLQYNKSVHMTATQIQIAEEITGWKKPRMNQYDIDFLDRIMMQRTEEAYHYGKRSYFEDD